MTGQGQQPVEAREYLAILKRRRKALLVPFIGILVIALGVALLLPPVYRSEATILVERQDIPQDLVATTVTGYVQERIQSLTQRLLTAERAWQVAESIGLAAYYGDALDRHEVVVALREGTIVETVDVKANQDSGRETTATVAFVVAFEAPTAALAKQGANAIADLYLEAERDSRRAQAKEVTLFLEAEAERLSQQISKLEEEFAEFKQENVNRLPELADLNLRLYEQTEDKLERTQERIRMLEDRGMHLRSQIAITRASAPLYGEDGARVMNPSERLAVLRTQYIKDSVKYSADHPDLARLRNEIDLLERQLGVSNGSGGMVAQLETLQAELADARQRYTDAHPDIRRLETQIAEVRTKLQRSATQASSRVQPEFVVADNPEYIKLTTELDSVGANLAAERQKAAQLERKRAELERRLVQTPVVERDYREISRDYENAVAKYRETQDKLLQARAAEQLEQTDRAQHFALVQAAFTPRQPERPNRLGIALLGFVLAMGGGLGFVAGAEAMDRSVRGTRDVLGMFGAPPIATIPFIELERERSTRRYLALLLLVVVVGSLALAWRSGYLPVVDETLANWLPATAEASGS